MSLPPESRASAPLTATELPAFNAAELMASLPELPGVYRMLGGEGQTAGELAVLYVGKAKSLKRRVSSYFQKHQHSPRISLMLGQVRHVEITVTRSEAEALILENTLIKRLAPKYNILFRDDKSYPYIALSGDEFPRLAYHRGGFVRGTHYFGPYPHGLAVREAIELLQKIFQLRTCENTVFRNRSRPCLLHQIRRCKAPCVGHVGQEEYQADVEAARLFLEGRHNEIIDELTQQMQAAANHLRFEAAAALRDQIRALQDVLQRQFVSTTGMENVDILVVVAEAGQLCVNLAMVRGGQHLGDRAHFPRQQVIAMAEGESWQDEEAAGLLAFIEQHYLDHPPPGRLILSHDLGPLDELFTALDKPLRAGLPRNEKERIWLRMALDNARLAIAARRQASSHARARLEALFDAIGDAAQLVEAPARIECFDISHTQGEGTQASCVVCVDGQMKSGDYRRFNISGIQPGDDHAAMRQALTRRYEKVASGMAAAPDLLIIDGGRGQLTVAREVLAELGLQTLVSMGIVKGEGRRPELDSLLVGSDMQRIELPAHHLGMHLVQEVRDEAHRFAITGHRARRAKTRTQSQLEDIPGVGPQRRRRLLAYFGGLAGVRNATVEDLCRVAGISRQLAEVIYNGLR